MISDNYLSAAVVSYQKSDCGSHFVSYFSHGILSIPTSSRGGCGRDGLPFPLYVFSCLLYPEPPWVGSRFTLHTTPPHLCWCLTVCFHSRLWGLGTFHHIERSHVIELAHVVLCGRGACTSSSVTKIPTAATSCGKVLCVYLTLYLST